MARYTTANSGMFGKNRPTRSPGRTPRRTKAWAVRSTRSCKAAKVMGCPSKIIAGRSGNARAALSRCWAIFTALVISPSLVRRALRDEMVADVVPVDVVAQAGGLGDV